MCHIIRSILQIIKNTQSSQPDALLCNTNNIYFKQSAYLVKSPPLTGFTFQHDLLKRLPIIQVLAIKHDKNGQCNHPCKL